MPLPYQPIQCYQYRQAHGLVKAESLVVTEANVTLTVNGLDWLPSHATRLPRCSGCRFLILTKVLSKPGMRLPWSRSAIRAQNVDVWLNRPVERPAKWQRTSGCTGGFTAASALPAPKVSTGDNLSPEVLLRCMNLLLQSQELYRETGGIHTSILTDGQFNKGKGGRHRPSQYA